ncbi:MAG: hypothetical protein HGA87_01555 [Desulfobulbaceae bacterium]|nr:hypothetical protein [Desulfobulbaceae bacterium]
MKKHFLIIAAIAAATFGGTAQAQDFSAGPKAGVFFGDKTAVFYGAEINKSLNDCFTVGASIMTGEVETRHTATRTVIVPCPVEKKATVNCVKPDPCKPTTRTEKYTAKRDSETVIAMLHGKYKLTGPLSIKGGAGVASIEGDKSLALSGGVSLDLPVSDKLTAGLTAEYLRLSDNVDGAMLSASVQYRF